MRSHAVCGRFTWPGRSRVRPGASTRADPALPALRLRSVRLTCGKIGRRAAAILPAALKGEFQMFFRSFVVAVATVSMMALAGCATRATRVDAQWVNPEFAGQRSMRSVMVMAAIRDSTNRRLFEDRMVGTLSAAGVKAVQSYKFIPADGPVSEDQLRRAIADAGAGHALVSRIINVTTEVNVTPGMVMGPTWTPGWGWSSGWGPSWSGFARYHNATWATTVPPRIDTTQSVHVDTRVFDAGTAAVVWSVATTTSTDWGSVPQLIEQFVGLIAETMKKDGII
jgi:hypothetical protein